jgi:hypothetical protein
MFFLEVLGYSKLSVKKEHARIEGLATRLFASSSSS